MKNNFKILLPIVSLLVMLSFVACEETIVKSDYDHKVDPNNVPKGVVTGDAQVYANKARIAGAIGAGQTLIDYGFVYSIDTIVNQYGSLEKAMLEGQISSKYMISMKKLNAGDNFEIMVTGLQPKRDYYYATYALNYDGLVLGEPDLFTTGSVLAPLLNIDGSSSQSKWNAIQWTQIDKDGDGQIFEFATINKKNGMASYTWKPVNNTYTPDNFLVTPGLPLGVDMRLDYVIYPSGKGASNYAEKFAIVISADSITLANCEEALCLDSLRFPETYKLDSVRQIVHTLAIPREYENKRVWIAIRHFDVTDKSALFIEKLKVY